MTGDYFFCWWHFSVPVSWHRFKAKTQFGNGFLCRLLNSFVQFPSGSLVTGLAPIDLRRGRAAGAGSGAIGSGAKESSYILVSAGYVPAAPNRQAGTVMCITTSVVTVP